MFGQIWLRAEVGRIAARERVFRDHFSTAAADGCGQNRLTSGDRVSNPPDSDSPQPPRRYPIIQTLFDWDDCPLGDIRATPYSLEHLDFPVNWTNPLDSDATTESRRCRRCRRGALGKNEDPLRPQPSPDETLRFTMRSCAPHGSQNS